MKRFSFVLVVTVLGLMTNALANPHGPADSVLPEGVKAVWDLKQAYREATPTRERVCLNGLWRWQPARNSTPSIPNADWGFFKVPGCWPGITDYMQKDCQTVYMPSAWRDEKLKLSTVTSAWYQREFTVPSEWTGRRITISMECLNSFANVWVDGQKAGDVRFPGGEADLTAFCKPGHTHVLSIQVTAMPLKGVLLSHGDTFGARQIQGTVERRGLCGDVYLVGSPATHQIDDIKVITSVRQWQIAFDVALNALDTNLDYVLRAHVADHGQTVKESISKPFRAADLKNGRFTFSQEWKPEKLWDVNTPSNVYAASISLLDTTGHVLDQALPERFGFRELWIDGRDFYLNGSRIFLNAVPLDNAQIGAAWATYDAARESLQRLKGIGINFVYTHNYGCEPGTHLSFAEVLRAADDEGVLVSFSQPHFGQYDWKSPDADKTNGYASHAAAYVQMAGNHPSVVFYSMSHNATGTEESMNPDMIDGIHDVRNQWSANNVKSALRAEAIVKQLDPGRIVYHHSSGNLGSMHTANFYANFTPIQEMSDWLEHWSKTGVKPLFLCEYATPLSWDWMMYRGWYKGTRTFGSADVPWEFCLAEWDAQFFGDQAFKVTDLEKDCLRWEARQFRDGRVWHRWDYPRNAIESTDVEQRNQVFAMYLTDNLRAFRTWGLSALCPWDHGVYWKLKDGVRHARKELKTDWDSLQRPGFSPDYVDGQMEWMNLSYDRSDWVPTIAGQALIRNNQPLLAYIGGKKSAFTSKDHNFVPGDLIQKQIIIINNSRTAVTADCSWSLGLPKPITGRCDAKIETGQHAELPVDCSLPENIEAGRYELHMTARFDNGQVQEDTFCIDVLSRPKPLHIQSRIALFDPKGETSKQLAVLGIHYTTIDSQADLSGFNVLIVGKGALSTDGPAPNITSVRDGLRVVMFEQTSDVLEKRFGFRVEEYGLRTASRRTPLHPVLTGLTEANLSNWHGEATLLPSRLTYEIGSRHAPEVKWCGIPVTRAWRAGNRGNVASVLIEKPARGDFMPIIDGGFGLQFSPLLEYHEGAGLILFCQLDVTGRTENDPAAELLARNLLEYAASWKPSTHRRVHYAGDPAGKQHLEHSGISSDNYTGEDISTGNILVLGPGSATQLPHQPAAISKFLESGGSLIAIGLDEEEANAVLPFTIKTKKSEHIATYFEPHDGAFAGIGPADVHNRDPRVVPLVCGGAEVVGNGVLAHATNANVVFCQLTPWDFSGSQSNLRRTYRHTSFLLTRLLSNMRAPSSTPVLERFHAPAKPNESRWLDGLYLDTPEEWDDPYRFFCW